ncbi:hypothetical protein [Wolbachia endosymbiont (group B) of Longitarsus flavicornis]|uniref:hypothetical protein n=1 Tax=Wolbachia endosymbiont (group B) of Longitarsus flavicornis TaxID=3066135 RepID=UPI00333E7D82
MFEFLCLKYLKDILTSRRYIPNSAKIELAELIEGVLELEGKKSVEEVNNILRSKMTNELKKDLRNVLRERYSLPSLAKLGLAKLINEVSDEMKQKINKLEQLEIENKDLQTKKDRAERLNRALEYARNTAQNENIELKAEKNKLNTQIQQSQQEKKILEVKNEANKQLKEKATYIATASNGLAVGLVVYITLEHTTKLDMWLIVVIATVSAFLAGDLIMKPSSQVNGTQEPQGVANKNSV